MGSLRVPLCATLGWFAACGSTGPIDSFTSESSEREVRSNGPVGDGKLTIFPAQAYTGFDGEHTFRAPLSAANSGHAVSWTIADRSLAELTPSAEQDFDLMLVARRAGETTLTAHSGDASATILVTITEYTATQYRAGEHRYRTSEDAKNPACTECHAPRKGPEHTPTELDSEPDSQLLRAYLDGVDAEGGAIDQHNEFSFLLRGKPHVWSFSEEEAIGLAAYLRALPPMGFPELDVPQNKR